MRAEPFIPLGRADLAARLLASPDLTEEERQMLASVFDALARRLHPEFFRRMESFKRLYAAFDPDATATTSAERSKDALHRLFDEFDELCQRANFRPLTLGELNAAMTRRSEWGLHLEVDIGAFERLDIFARGAVCGTRTRRRARNFFRLEELEVPIYERLIVMFRLGNKRRFHRYADTERVFIKLFKDIPQMDLDMLLPATSVKMTIVDRLKIILPTLSGVGLAVWKILQGALLAAFAGVYGVLAVLGLIGGTVGYGVRSFYGYLNTKNRYQLSLTESLYYQNLDNNAGVFFRLLDEAEEQENGEALLAYFFLWRFAPSEGWTSAQLDAAVEQFLHPLVRRSVDFEVDDALAKLERLGIALRAATGTYLALPPAEARMALERGVAKEDLIGGQTC